MIEYDHLHIFRTSFFNSSCQDCSTSPYTSDDVGLPSATLGHDDTTEFFATEFGFDANETVALLGAHTLGKASQDNSGFRGPWVNGETMYFNNEYYKVCQYYNFISLQLIQKMCDSTIGWTQRDVGTDDSRWQWSASGVAFMLNVDMSLYKDIEVDSDGESSCDFDTCAAAPTESVVEAYAASNDVWMADFTAVYTKMLAHGASNLQDLS